MWASSIQAGAETRPRGPSRGDDGALFRPPCARRGLRCTSSLRRGRRGFEASSVTLPPAPRIPKWGGFGRDPKTLRCQRAPHGGGRVRIVRQGSPVTVEGADRRRADRHHDAFPNAELHPLVESSMSSAASRSSTKGGCQCDLIVWVERLAGFAPTLRPCITVRLFGVVRLIPAFGRTNGSQRRLKAKIQVPR